MRDCAAWSVEIAFVAQRISNWQEIFVERNVQFGRQNFLRVARVIVSKSLENLSGFARGSFQLFAIRW